MRILIPALAAASLLMVSLPGFSADDVKAGGASSKPARALDDGAVKSGGASKPGRAVDDGAVKSGAATDKPARAVDGEKKSKKKKAKKVAPQ